MKGKYLLLGTNPSHQRHCMATAKPSGETIGESTLDRRHAVAIGASMAGLLAARVLSDHFAQVTMIERDRLTADDQPRKGVPQGRPVHGLLARGAVLMREYFPDLFRNLAQDGAIEEMFNGHNGLVGFSQRFQQAIARDIETPWLLSTGEDVRYPGTQAKRSLSIRLLKWYMRRVIELAASDAQVAAALLRVRYLLKPLSTLFQTRIMLAMLRRELSSWRRQPPVTAQQAREVRQSPVGMSRYMAK